MSDRAEHRGPDDSGWLVASSDGRIWKDREDEGTSRRPDEERELALGLGHRRLSIIDLSPAGHQPMGEPSGRYWIVYNGEVYNYLELRSELEARGRAFSSRTDSEVVLQAFLEWGPRCLSRFNGMWAFAIYDRRDESLFCARDRYGVKPFCYAGEPGRFAFGSEAKQLVSLPWVGCRANRARLADFFLWRLETHTDETFFAGVRTLPGSHYLVVTREDLERGRFEPVRYWQPETFGQPAERDAVEEFRDLLFDSVRLRLRSDVPVGVTLSGGIDSSSIACIAGEQRRRAGDASALDAFNVEFEGERFSERRYAEAAASRAGSRFVVLRPDPQDLARDWTRFVWHMEQPFDSLSYFANFQIYALIRQQGVPVVLSGQGGDELLLGYERYRSYETLFSMRAGRPIAGLVEAARATKNANMPLLKQLGNGLYFSLPWLRAARRRQLARPILKEEFYREHAGETQELIRSMRHRDRRALQVSELFHFQLPHLLHHEDRMSMAHSVETRLPFLDYRLLNLVLRLTSQVLFRDGWSKYILRQAMDGIVPDEVRQRTDKMGYETPTGSLLRRNREWFVPLLRRHRDDPVVNSGAIERGLDSGRFDERLLCGALSYLSWKEAMSVAD